MLQNIYDNFQDDLVTCFLCQKSLRSWEPTDEPWSEHTRHFPECHFVLDSSLTSNIATSFIAATAPAVQLEPALATVSVCPGNGSHLYNMHCFSVLVFKAFQLVGMSLCGCVLGKWYHFGVQCGAILSESASLSSHHATSQRTEGAALLRRNS